MQVMYLLGMIVGSIAFFTNMAAGNRSAMLMSLASVLWCVTGTTSERKYEQEKRKHD